MTDTTATIVTAAIVGLPLVIASISTAINARATSRRLDRRVELLQENVERIEKHTNGMIAKIEQASKTEGKAEVLETLAAVTPAIPLAITPVTNQKEIVEWIAQGVALEKARRAAENGVKKADP